MSFSRNLFALAKSADGRGRLVTLTSILVLASLLVLVLAVLPASAGSGGPSVAGVVPVEIAYGGGSGACSANFPGRLPSDASYELHINNPQSGTYTGPDGTRVTLTVTGGDKYFSFQFEDSAMVALDVVVNGGANNTHFDYDGNGGPGPRSADAALHAPTKGGSSNLYQLSHINICYDLNPLADLSVTKTPVGGGTASEGDVVEFEIVVSNADVPVSNTTATGVVVTDTIPEGMMFVSASGPADITGTLGTDSEGNTTYTWTGTGLDLPPDTSITLTIVLQVETDTGGQDLVNSVSVTGGQTDPNPGDENAVSVPPVTVNANLSGTVFVDENANSAYDAGEPPDSTDDPVRGLTVTVYDSSGTFVGSQESSLVDGSYSFALAPTEPEDYYTVCLESRNTHQQTIPDLPPEGTGVDCSSLDGNEPEGYQVTLTANSTANDFGNLPLITCGIPEEISNGTFTSAEFTIFANSVRECGQKGLSFFFYDSVTGEPDPNGDTAAVLLDGQGEAAGRGVFVKEFASAAGFVPLTYAPTAAQLGSAIEPSWCNVRAYESGDGSEFNEWLGSANYPTLFGVVDAFGTPPGVCKVAEIETVALVDGLTVGIQTTVVYTETDDPYFR